MKCSRSAFIALSGVVFLSLSIVPNAASATQQPEDRKAVIPQVWVDEATSIFHSPACKLATKKMVRRARTVAKMQGIKPATECAMTDADAAKQWREELKKPISTITRAGGYSVGTGTSQPPSIQKSPATRRTPEVEPRRQSAPPPPPTWNEMMAASNWTDAPKTIRDHCSREWPNDARMQTYCVDRQIEGLNALQKKEPFTPGERVTRVQCAREWPDDFRMRKYCEDRAAK